MKKLFFISILVFTFSCKKWETYKRTHVHGKIYDLGNQKNIPNALFTLTYYGYTPKKGIFDLKPDMMSEVVYNGRTDANGEFAFTFDAYDPKQDDGLTNYVIRYQSEGVPGTSYEKYDDGAKYYDRIPQPPNFWWSTAVMNYGTENEINLYSVFLATINWQFTNLPAVPNPDVSYSLSYSNVFGTRSLYSYLPSDQIILANEIWSTNNIETASAKTTFHFVKNFNGISIAKDTIIDLPPTTSSEKYTIYLPLF